VSYSQALWFDQRKPRFDKQEDIYKGADGIQSPML
jgi:hypothetical protein